MSPEDRQFIRNFFRQVTDQPLEPGDPRYVNIYEDRRLLPSDPVELMARAIEFTPGESVQLLSGFRGTGKSTELRRLQKRLREAGYLVVLCDIEDYLNLSTRVDVSDFLMALAGAFGEALVKQELLEGDPVQESYWSRFVNFLVRTRVEFSEISGKLGTEGASVSLKANLKNDPTFRARLQESMAGHLGALVTDVRSFLEECVKKLKERHGQETETVLLVDSVEHIRGTSVNALEVQSSVETLFAAHADKLRLPYLHVIYTVPPYLKVRYANLGALYAPGGLQVLPSLKLRSESDGSEYPPGIEACTLVVSGRGDWRRLLGDRDALKTLILHAGGQLRDLLRLLSEVIRRTDTLPATPATVDEAISQIKNEFLPIADADALWLARIARTHRASLDDAARLPDLARFLDTHLVLCYRNDSEWYDVHPLIRDEILAQATEIESRPAASSQTNQKSSSG